VVSSSAPANATSDEVQAAQQILRSLNAQIAERKAAGKPTADLEAVRAHWENVGKPGATTQPFDTVARQDLISAVEADIAAAQGSMAKTTGLHELLDRVRLLPEYIDRVGARKIVKNINMALAPRFHNAINDPAAIAAEKGLGRTITAAMLTPEMRAANARYETLKPMGVAMSHAAKRSGARDIVGLKGAMAAAALATEGGREFGPLGFLGGGALGLGMSAASHPVVKGTVGQTAYNLGKALPGYARRAGDPEMVRQLILQMLNGG
jgi:hypothetical protein